MHNGMLTLDLYLFLYTLYSVQYYTEKPGSGFENIKLATYLHEYDVLFLLNASRVFVSFLSNFLSLGILMEYYPGDMIKSPVWYDWNYPLCQIRWHLASFDNRFYADVAQTYLCDWTLSWSIWGIIFYKEEFGRFTLILNQYEHVFRSVFCNESDQRWWVFFFRKLF